MSDIDHEPAPVANSERPIFDRVIDDLRAKAAEWRKKYGTHLQPFNGRDAVRDAYQEALDMAQYLKQALVEGDANARRLAYLEGLFAEVETIAADGELGVTRESLLEAIEKRDARVVKLRGIIIAIVNKLPGSCAALDVSDEFLSHVPSEVASVIDKFQKAAVHV